MPRFSVISTRILFNICLAVTMLMGQQPSAYVTGIASNDVSVIQPSTTSLLTTIPVGDSPRGMAFTSDGSRLFVGNENENTLSVIRTETNKQIDVIPISSNPFALAVTPDGTRVYITMPADNRVAVYDLRSKRQIALIPVMDGPYRVVIHPNGSRAYVTSANGSNLAVIDTFFNRIVQNIPVGYSGTALAISPGGSRVFVSTQFPGGLPDQGPGAIWSIDTRTNEIVGSVRGQFNGDALAVSRDGSRLYAINPIGLATFQSEPLTLLKTIPLEGFVLSIAAAASGPTLYLVYTLDNVTKVFDTVSDSIVATIPTGSFPLEVAIARLSPPRPILPLATCVRREGLTYQAVFGYISENETAVAIATGPENRFTPVPENRGQVTNFTRGLVPAAFRISFDGNPLTWSLTGPDGITRTAIASRNSFTCPF